MRSALFALMGLAVLSPAALAQSPAALAAKSAQNYAAAAPGLVEPFSEERQIASQVIGVIGKMLVDENDEVAADQPIAIVENSEQAAQVAASRARLAEAQAQLDRLLHGARPEERREAKDQLEQLDAELELAKLEYDRKKPLRASGAASQASLDQVTSAMHSLKMRRAAMAERLAVIETAPAPRTSPPPARWWSG